MCIASGRDFFPAHAAGGRHCLSTIHQEISDWSGMSLNKRRLFWVSVSVLAIHLSGCVVNRMQDDAESSGSDEVSTQEASGDGAEQASGSLAEQVEAGSTMSGANLGNAPLVARRFADGVAFYNDGKFANAIRVFREPVFDRAWPELRVRSLRYLAFSYCVSDQLPQCRKSFAEILKLQPDFTLTAAERGHPIWGPVFVQVQKESAAKANP